MNGMVECQDCYFSELIDSTLYCHHNCEDVSFKQYCTDFVNYNMFVELCKGIIENINNEFIEKYG